MEDRTTPTIAIPFSYNVVQILASLAQLCFAIGTIYRARGGQLDRYGYAAFGLTVIPYVWMSLVNILANLIRPQYSSVYLVKSVLMDEARQVEGTVFDITVRRLDENPDDEQRDKAQPSSYVKQPLQVPESHTRRMARKARRENIQGQITGMTQKLPLIPLVVLPTVLTILIIGLLTRFESRSSTLTERVCTMSWLAVGGWVEGAPTQERDYRSRKSWGNTYLFAFKVVYFAGPIAGYVVVGQMLSEYGVCVRLD